MSGKHDFYIDSGTTWNRAITWADADNAPYDITDYTARMHFIKISKAMIMLLHIAAAI